MKIVAKLIKKAGVIFLGKMANALWDSVRRNVSAAEAAGGTGDDKFKKAIKGIDKEIGGLEGFMKFWAKIFIELFVMELKQNKGIIRF